MAEVSRAAIGAPAPDATLMTGKGEEVQLSDLWKDKPLVLVFLRHLG